MGIDFKLNSLTFGDVLIILVSLAAFLMWLWVLVMGARRIGPHAPYRTGRILTISVAVSASFAYFLQAIFTYLLTGTTPAGVAFLSDISRSVAATERGVLFITAVAVLVAYWAPIPKDELL